MDLKILNYFINVETLTFYGIEQIDNLSLLTVIPKKELFIENSGIKPTKLNLKSKELERIYVISGSSKENGFDWEPAITMILLRKKFKF